MVPERTAAGAGHCWGKRACVVAAADADAAHLDERHQVVDLAAGDATVLSPPFPADHTPPPSTAGYCTTTREGHSGDPTRAFESASRRLISAFKLNSESERRWLFKLKHISRSGRTNEQTRVVAMVNQFKFTLINNQSIAIIGLLIARPFVEGILTAVLQKNCARVLVRFHEAENDVHALRRCDRCFVRAPGRPPCMGGKNVLRSPYTDD